MADKDLLERVKRHLGIDYNDSDDMIAEIIKGAENEFKAITGQSYVAMKYEYMIIDIASKRYVRRGSEGISSESDGAYSVTYEDTENDFAKYMDILNRDFKLRDRERGNLYFF